MKKVLFYTSIIILITIVVCVVVVEQSIVRVQLPHGAVLHVWPAYNNHAHGAVILCPGGGYHHQSKWHEGYWWFPFFHRQGFTVAMLEYRLPNRNHEAPMVDGAEAVQFMRTCAEKWNFDKHYVGIMGFSAGGHLASTLMVRDRASGRPDFGILFYPVISMKKELTHQGSHDHLLGKDASREIEDRYSNELHVSAQTPPAFIALSCDDSIVKPQNSICFYDEMCTKKRPVVLHVYPSGGHSWGYRFSFPYHRQMLDDLACWLNMFRKM